MRMLGYPVSIEYELAVKRSIADRSLQKKMKREAIAAKANLQDDFSAGEWAFIAGYTSGGAPYGITWEEMDGTDFL